MKSVQIKIKSPSANYSDVELHFQLDETVLSVKEKIEENFPTKPPVSGQKLVYSGKILSDGSELKDVLRLEDEVTTFTFHLVCALPQKQKPELRESPAPETELRQRHTATSSTSSSTTSSSSSADLGESDQMAEMMREFSNQYSAAMASMANNPSESEIAAMQQMYNQYVSLYMQYVQAQSLQQAPLFVPQEQQVGGAGVDLQPQVAPEAGQAGNEGPAGAPGPGGLVMNAGAAAGQIQDMGDRQRDMLDWVYLMTRVMLIFSMVYFNTSFLRLAFVAGLGFLAYFYQNRIRPAQNIQQQPPEQQNQPAQADQANTEAETETEEADVEVVEETPPSKLAVLVTFFTSLVSSIIPEQPQVI